MSRDIPSLLRDAEALSEIADEHSLAFLATIARFWTSWANATTSVDAQGIEALRKAADDWWAVGAGNYKSYFPSLIAELEIQAGDLGAARQSLQKADHCLTKTEEKWAEAEQLRIKAELLAQSGSDPEALFQQAIETARRQGARLFELRASVALAQWRHRNGVAAGDGLGTVVGHFDQDMDLPDLQDARALLETIS